MSKPFEAHIPHYPGEERTGLPTADTTVFNDPVVVGSLELVNTFTHPSTNSRGRDDLSRKISTYCFTDGSFHTFMQVASDLLETGSSRPERLSRIRQLVSRLDSEYLNNDFIGTRNRPAVIPERTQFDEAELTSRVSLANDALQSMFPNHFGRVIPVIQMDDIVPARDEDVLRYQKDDAGFTTHSFRTKAYDSYAESARLPRGKRLSRKESKAMIQVNTREIGMPIIMPLDSLDIQHENLTENHRQIILDFNVVRSLIHENFHRSIEKIEPLPTSPEDPFWKLAWDPDVGLLKRMEDEKDPNSQHFRKFLETVMSYTTTHNPRIRIEGARVQIYCDDEKGVARLMTESGYDFNEAIIEALTYRTFSHFLSYAEKTYDTELNSRMTQFTSQIFQSDETYRHGNLFNHLQPYFHAMQLRSPEETLEAYSSHKIPLLYAKHLPDEPYLF